MQGPTGCDVVPFDPSISVSPDTTQPDSPAGVVVWSEHARRMVLDNPLGLRSADLRSAPRSTFPEGMTISPSAASGLDACTDEQIGIGNDDPVACPDASRIGTVTATTPLLDEPLDGPSVCGLSAVR